MVELKGAGATMMTIFATLVRVRFDHDLHTPGPSDLPAKRKLGQTVADQHRDELLRP